MVFLLPAGAIAYYIYMPKSNVNIGIAVLLAAAGIALNKPLQALRVKYRHDVEYDEFGRSKSKGNYEYLSKAERDKMDLQKTLDMERIMDSSALKKMTKKGAKDPEKEMNSLVGLVPVKNKMREMVARMKFEKGQGKKKEITSMSGRHMVFYGSPGTGKTTVARIITGFLYKYGYIKENKCVEVDGNFLKAGSDTATKTELVIRQAFGGVLFIDEAYALMESGDGSGEQIKILSQILKEEIEEFDKLSKDEAKKKAQEDLKEIGFLDDQGNVTEPYIALRQECTARKCQW